MLSGPQLLPGACEAYSGAAEDVRPAIAHGAEGWGRQGNRRVGVLRPREPQGRGSIFCRWDMLGESDGAGPWAREASNPQLSVDRVTSWSVTHVGRSRASPSSKMGHRERRACEDLKHRKEVSAEFPSLEQVNLCPNSALSPPPTGAMRTTHRPGRPGELNAPDPEGLRTPPDGLLVGRLPGQLCWAVTLPCGPLDHVPWKGVRR